MLMNRLTVGSPSNYPPSVGKFRPEQIAQASTWDGVPDADSALAAMHVVHVVPHGASTVTRLNPLDPGTVAGDADDAATMPGWRYRPGDDGRLVRAGRRL